MGKCRVLRSLQREGPIKTEYHPQWKVVLWAEKPASRGILSCQEKDNGGQGTGSHGSGVPSSSWAWLAIPFHSSESWKSSQHSAPFIQPPVPQNIQRLRRGPGMAHTGICLPKTEHRWATLERACTLSWGNAEPWKAWGRGRDTTQGVRDRGQTLSSEWLTPEPVTFNQPHICGIPRFVRSRPGGNREKKDQTHFWSG